ncbi:PTS sugar transporter subunit IIA [Corynebacterium sp.]|uniref:PTS sugar transporter subunit IIA n=1 Tax=Corynebacterium sp. TaxID=1720 RepID=UPI0026DCF82D|nr:PTS sugar transporter subunit IIA [Corynebacterium sp.]MDO5077030.1 PTS sugar transporter subunit IIA [Corynebacterium sp.]
MTSLSELLATDAIALDVQVRNWEAAIRLAGQLLESTGAVEPEYTEAMLDVVKDNGPYIVVAPGFAFAHARPSRSVHTTAMSWVRLAEPVEFGHPKNDPVTLVVALAAKDSTEHTKAMAQLARLLSKPDTKALLDAAMTGDDLLEILGREPVAATESEVADIIDTKQRNKILTVCGNGLGTSLFLKNTLEEVLSRWGWAPYVSVEATDTISAKGKAQEADLILTSGEIAHTLEGVGVPVAVIHNFTDPFEVDAVLRDLYDV